MSTSNVIEGFESLTLQQLFDISARHVLANGRASYSTHLNGDGLVVGGSCVYSGIGCAAAPFLTPVARGWLKGRWEKLVAERLVPRHEWEFIQDLQDAHDRADRSKYQDCSDGPDQRFITSFKLRMKLLANRKGLDKSVLGDVS